MSRVRTGSIVQANRTIGKGNYTCNGTADFYRPTKKGCRVICVVISICFAFYLFSFNASADQLDDQYNELYDMLEIDELVEIGDEISGEYYTPDLSSKSNLWEINGYDLIQKIIKNNISLSGSCINTLSVALVFSIVFLISKCVLYDKKDLSVSYETIVNGVCATAFLIPVSLLVDDVCEAVSTCCVFMNAFIPIYSALIVTVGYAATSVSYSTLMFLVTQIFTIISNSLLVPICNITLVSSVGAAFNNTAKGYYEFFKKMLVVILSTTMAIFIAVLNLQTAVSVPSDTIGLKTVKTAMGTFIPIVGTALSDSVSVLLAGAGVLRSTIGVYAVINIVVCVLPILVKLLMWRITASISGMLLELSGSSFSVNIVKSIGSAITLFISILLCVAVAYLLSVILTLSIGG